MEGQRLDFQIKTDSNRGFEPLQRTRVELLRKA